MKRWVVIVVFFALVAPLYAQSELRLFEQDGRWGYRDAQGRIVIPAHYQIARDFTAGGIAAVVDKEGWVYIDRRGQIVIRPFPVDNGPDYFSEGVGRFRQKGKFGYFDERGKVVIPPRFDYAAPFSYGLAAVCMGCTERADGEHTSWQGGRWGYTDKQGRIAIAPVYEAADPFEKGRARVRHAQQWIYIDTKGRVLSDTDALR